MVMGKHAGIKNIHENQNSINMNKYTKLFNSSTQLTRSNYTCPSVPDYEQKQIIHYGLASKTTIKHMRINNTCTANKFKRISVALRCTCTSLHSKRISTRKHVADMCRVFLKVPPRQTTIRKSLHCKLREGTNSWQGQRHALVHFNSLN